MDLVRNELCIPYKSENQRIDPSWLFLTKKIYVMIVEKNGCQPIKMQIWKLNLTKMNLNIIHLVLEAPWQIACARRWPSYS